MKKAIASDVLFGIALFGCMPTGCGKAPPEPIRVGMLHSLTGTMASSEGSVIDATLLAIYEINARGGLLGRCINGDGNIAFFDALWAAGMTPATAPTMSFSFAEDELRSMNRSRMTGNYCAWNYFQSLNTRENLEFVTRFKARYGENRVVDDPMEAAYLGVHLWAQAVQQANTTDTDAVRKALAGQSFAAPEGLVTIDPATQHTAKTARIGKIRADGQFEIVWTSKAAIPPSPFPEFRSRAEWEEFLANMFSGWGQRWANPGK